METPYPRRGSSGSSAAKRQIHVPEATRRELEASGQQLEACEVVEGDWNFLVRVFRVNYGDQPLPENPPRVVRFSKSEHSFRTAPSMLLSSPSYYRKLEEKSAPPEQEARERGRERPIEDETRVASVGDRMEARYKKGYGIDEFHHEFVPSLAAAQVSGSAQVTYEIGDFWMLCTSVEPSTGAEFKMLRREFAKYDCATIIPYPSDFALQLGKDFGRQHGEEAVRRDGLAILHVAKIAIGFLKAGAPVPETVVDIHHGQVVYSDEPSEVVECYPERFRGLVLPFVKRRKFEGEREYRFTVSLGSEPKRQRICVDLSDNLRGLVAPYPKG